VVALQAPVQPLSVPPQLSRRYGGVGLDRGVTASAVGGGVQSALLEDSVALLDRGRDACPI
jgi:hypothetical protein